MHVRLFFLWIFSSYLLAQEIVIVDEVSQKKISLDAKNIDTWGQIWKRAQKKFGKPGLIFEHMAETKFWAFKCEKAEKFVANEKEAVNDMGFYPVSKAMADFFDKAFNLEEYSIPQLLMPDYLGSDKWIDPRDPAWQSYVKHLVVGQEIPKKKVKPKARPVLLLVADFWEKQEKNILDSITIDEASFREYQEKSPYFSYPIDKLSTQLKLYRVLQKYEKTREFPFVELWRFMVDSHRQVLGPYAFENEPGYMRGALQGLAVALSSYSINANADWYEKVHEATITGVRIFDNGLKALDFGYGDKVVSYGIGSSDSDDHGLADLKKQGKNSKLRNAQGKYYLYNEEDSGRTSRYVPAVGKIIMIEQHDKKNDRKEQADRLFAKAKKYLAKPREKTERLMAYLWLARELEINHLFTDANGRASYFTLLSMILNDAELPMLMLENANVLDANGPEKLLVRVLQGMDNFLQKGQDRIFSVTTTELVLSKQKFSHASIESLRLELVDFIQKDPARKKWQYFHKAMNQ